MNKNLGCIKKLYNLLRTLSLFKLKNGIHHKRKLYYASKCSVVSSSLLITFLLLFSINKFKLFGAVVSKNYEQISRKDSFHAILKENRIIENPNKFKNFNFEEIDERALGPFPFYVYAYGITCEDGIHLEFGL